MSMTSGRPCFTRRMRPTDWHTSVLGDAIMSVVSVLMSSPSDAMAYVAMMTLRDSLAFRSASFMPPM